MNSNLWRDLTLREKIGQTMIYRTSEGFPHKVMEDPVSKGIGGLTVGVEVIKDATGDEHIQFTIDQIRKYGALSRIPLLHPGDFENGCGISVTGLTYLPHLMALGAANSEELAYAYGKATALEARSVGVNINFGPVVDLNINMFNPLTNIRSVSDDPIRAIPLLKAVVAGMQDHGLAAMAKHFPGDGMDYRDQHLVQTENSLSEREWWANHGVVFQAVIDAGVSGIMVGHISLPALQTPNANGGYEPATRSYELMTTLLKEKMGFKGVVCSDALIMGGFLRGHNPDEWTRLEIECFKAGADMLSRPTEAYLDAMEEAVLSGKVSMERLDDAVSRIWAVKERFGLFEDDYQAIVPLTEEARIFAARTAEDTAERSLTLLQNKSQFLPLRREDIKRVLLITIARHDAGHDELSVLKTDLEERGIGVQVVRNGSDDYRPADYDLAIYALSSRQNRPFGQVNFFDEAAIGIWRSLLNGVEKSVVVSFGSPYHFKEYLQGARSFVNAYSPAPASQRAFVKALFGEIEFRGTSPVRL